MADHGFWNFAAQAPEKLALIAPDESTYTRGELLALCNQAVAGMRAQGLGHGDVVAICAKNCAEYFILTLACQQAGLYVSPINWHLAATEVAYVLKDSGAKLFLGDEGAAQICIDAAKEVGFPQEACFSVGAVEGFRPFAELLEGQSTELPENRSAGATMNYTSGTTGNPKGVKRGLPPEGVEPEMVFSLYAMQWLLYGLAPEDDNVHIVGSPLYHTAVLIFSTSALHFGHALVVMEKWTPEGMLRLIDKYKVTSSHMVPTQFHRMLQLPEEVRSQYDCSSTRAMIHAAAPCPPDIKRQMIEWWGKSIWEYYAATEGGGTVVSPDEWLKYPGTVGKAWPTAEVRIYDDEGKRLGPDEQGTVYMLLSDQIKFEYKGDAKKTKKDRINEDGNVYFTVGDIGYLNEEGYLFLCDRKIDMIISGGANIYPAEIENVFFTHPKVGDVCVFGIPHPDWGEEIKAVVEAAAGVTPGDALSAELLEYCKTKLGKFKVPKSIDYIEKMPRDENGKLPKRKLRDPYWEGHERAI